MRVWCNCILCIPRLIFCPILFNIFFQWFFLFHFKTKASVHNFADDNSLYYHHQVGWKRRRGGHWTAGWHWTVLTAMPQDICVLDCILKVSVPQPQSFWNAPTTFDLVFCLNNNFQMKKIWWLETKLWSKVIFS